MNYRAEIDGLRALAVLSVIFFHAGFTGFSGGFVGVDIFFVISGYVITTIIISELAEGTFSLLHFYERRARRILPALFFMLLACLPFAWMWLTPIELKSFGQSVVAVSNFSSNMLFWLESGYFDRASELKPLLHTWSLAVEAQYYIFFSVFLMLTWRLGVQWILSLLFLVFLASLIGAQGDNFNKSSAGFFLLYTRLWELLIGVFIAFYLKYNNFLQSHLANQLLSLGGFAMVMYAIVIFDKNTPFPSFYALIPTVGTGLLILSGVPKTIAHKVLNFSPLVGLGLISYSAYLWHQPILAFTRHRFVWPLSYEALVVVCTMSLVMAYLSWRYIEKPFRDKEKITRRVVIGCSVAGIWCFSLIGIAIQSEDYRLRSPNYLPTIVYSSLGEKLIRKGEVCEEKNGKVHAPFTYCYFGDLSSDQSIILYGDSHASALQYALDKQLKENSIKGIWLRKVFSGGRRCETTIFTTAQKNAGVTSLLGCPRSFLEVLDYFNDASYLILASRWTMRYFPVEAPIETHSFDNIMLGCKEIDVAYQEFVAMDATGFSTDNIQGKSSAIFNLLELVNTVMPTLLVYPIPEVGCDVYKYNLKNYWTEGVIIEDLSFPVSEYDIRNEFVISHFDSFVRTNESSNIIPIQTREIFCNHFKGGECSVIYESTPLYYDDDHVSDLGASLIVAEIFESIQARDE